VRGPLSLPKYDYGVTSNTSYGWFGGGATFPDRSTVDRIDYSNDNATASVRGPLSSARSALAATGNSNFGYFVGGGTTNIDRINYSNDMVILLKKGTTSSLKNSSGATGNINFGYFGGGIPPIPAGTLSTVDRIDYSNDTQTTSLRGPLSSSRRNISATGNSNFGYFGGGAPGGAVLDRISYSNDTVTASQRGTLTNQQSVGTTNAANS
jgi:hypothetical protein